MLTFGCVENVGEDRVDYRLALTRFGSNLDG